jgi:hypothetical protein
VKWVARAPAGNTEEKIAGRREQRRDETERPRGKAEKLGQWIILNGR